MAVCLDDINTSLTEIAESLSGGEFGADVSVSLEASASSASSALAVSQSIAIANAVAAAQAYAIALNIVTVDVRVEQTAVVQLLLPPVSTTEPPATTDYPPEDTGVTATAAGTEVDGVLCNRIFSNIQFVIDLLTVLEGISRPVYFVAGLVLTYLELALKAGLGIARIAIVPAAVMAAVAALLGELAAATEDPPEEIRLARISLSADRNQMSCDLYDAAVAGDDSFELAELAWGFVEDWDGVHPIVKAVVRALLGPQVWASAIYLPYSLPAPPSTFECDSCGV